MNTLWLLNGEIVPFNLEEHSYSKLKFLFWKAQENQEALLIAAPVDDKIKWPSDVANAFREVIPQKHPDGGGTISRKFGIEGWTSADFNVETPVEFRSCIDDTLRKRS